MKCRNRKHRELLFNGRAAFILAINISLIMLFITLISYFFARVRITGMDVHLGNFFTISYVYNLLLDFLSLYILFSFQFFIINRTSAESKKRVLVMCLGSLLLIIVLSPILSGLYILIIPEKIPQNIFISITFVKHAVLLLITLLFSFLMIMWKKQQIMTEQNSKLLLENIQSRYDVLKSQLDPHFLFNSLNTLNGLIGNDDKKAHEYVEQLSEVFRYSIQNKSIIKLSEELNFVESYSYLMKIRYGEALKVYIHIDNKYLDDYILPCGLQLLFENAVKHNVISNKYPLTITIETTDEDIVRVKNNLQPKKGQTESGVGLVNLKERYRLMFGKKEINIIHDDISFIVEIPLIKEMDDTTFNVLTIKS